MDKNKIRITEKKLNELLTQHYPAVRKSILSSMNFYKKMDPRATELYYELPITKPINDEKTPIASSTHLEQSYTYLDFDMKPKTSSPIAVPYDIPLPQQTPTSPPKIINGTEDEWKTCIKWYKNNKLKIKFDNIHSIENKYYCNLIRLLIIDQNFRTNFKDSLDSYKEEFECFIHLCEKWDKGRQGEYCFDTNEWYYVDLVLNGEIFASSKPSKDNLSDNYLIKFENVQIKKTWVDGTKEKAGNYLYVKEISPKQIGVLTRKVSGPKRIGIVKTVKKQTDLETIDKLIESGTKEVWNSVIINHLKNNIKLKLPALDHSKCKFPGYGYRRFIELIIESKDLLRIMTEAKDVSGARVVTLNSLIRGDDSTLRGIEALCKLLFNKTTIYNPVSETDFKYLNLIFDSFTEPVKEGNNKIWNIETEKMKLKISASFDKENREWVYKID